MAHDNHICSLEVNAVNFVNINKFLPGSKQIVAVKLSNKLEVKLFFLKRKKTCIYYILEYVQMLQEWFIYSNSV